MEIERRWLMAGFLEDSPAAPAGPGTGAPQFLCEVEKAQAYLCTAPVVRIRSERWPGAGGQVQQQYILCVKGPGTLARAEIETPITAEVYRQLAELIGVPPIHKRTRLYRLADGHELECSLVDEGEAMAFYYAEVEFTSVEEATAFVPPAFLGQEKTEDPTFSMSSYWRRKCAAYAAAQAGAAPAAAAAAPVTPTAPAANTAAALSTAARAQATSVALQTSAPAAPAAPAAAQTHTVPQTSAAPQSSAAPQKEDP